MTAKKLDKSELVRTAISLSLGELERLKSLAEANETTASDVVRRALEFYASNLEQALEEEMKERLKRSLSGTN